VSGITPLLDTLLHQVLGRRVDIPVAKDLNAAVSAPVPAQGARPLHSDSRLDPRDQAPAIQVSAATRNQAAHGPAGQAPSAGQASSFAQPQPSTTTSFSSAARLIGDLLQRFPAPPAAITPTSPLLTEAPAGPQAAIQISGQLQQSIQSSGLFYEAHVARWSRGELPLEALQREPQMRALSMAPQPPAVQGASVAQEPAAPGAVVVREPAPMLVGDPLGAVEQRVEVVDPGSVVGERESGAVSEAQLPLLRQQLEMLAAPQLRWEGNVWVGVFVALIIQPPTTHAQAEGGGEPAGEGAEGQGAWQVRLALRLEGHGELEVAISLQGERLTLTLQTESASLRGYFAQTRGALEECLAGHGFSEVSLHLLELDGEVDDGR
jgi:hypothetical protein